MDMKHLCMKCMADKGTTGVCPYCGWDNSAEAEPSIYLRPGTVLNGKYLVGKVLGHGGFGITYLSWDFVLQVKRVIKEYFQGELATRSQDNTTISIYPGEKTSDFNYGKGKFLEEARTLARFDHEGIVAVKEYFEENNTAYFVMDFMDGFTFKEYIDMNGGKIPWETAVQIMMPVLDALREVHRTKILHRDISPDNIYITNKGHVRVLDFGAARQAIGERSKSLSVILKPGYAPEEQYKSNGKQGAWTDVYASAATLYKAVTGTVPPESLERCESDTLKAPSRFTSGIPSYLESALLKALAVRSGGRFQSIKEFQDAILSERISASPPKPDNSIKPEPEPVKPIKPEPSPPLDPDELQGRGFISKMVRGDYGLFKTYWLCLVVGGTVGFFMCPISLAFGMNGLAYSLFIIWAIYSFLACIGTWRASNKYHGSVLWSAFAKIGVISSLLVIVLFLLGFLNEIFNG